MAQILTIAHNIFLTRTQRYELQNEDCILEVTGASLPVWIVDGLATENNQEIFCRYQISRISKETIALQGQIYHICLSQEMARNLLDIADGGCASFSCNIASATKINDQIYKTVHYLNIQDLAVLER